MRKEGGSSHAESAKIAHAHGGQINVHAHPAATVFAVSLPRFPDQTAAAAAAAA